MRVKKGVIGIVGFLCLLGAARGEEASSLTPGFGKVRWGMTNEAIIDAYHIVLKMPDRADPVGEWAFFGPAPGELTVSGEALGEPEIRSVSFGVHPKWGLAIAHVRFRDTNDPGYVEKLLPKWIARFGAPKARRPGPKIIWEDGTTHVELTYHTVSPRHPSPTDHLAIVLWSIPLMKKIEAEGMGPVTRPDVEKLEPMKEPHKKKGTK